MKTIILMPTYNEKENVPRITEQVLRHACDLLYIDDNSPDGTAEIVEDLIKSDDRIKLLKRPGKMGLGSAYLAGFKYALENGYDKVITMDADLSHPPEKIPEMINTDADFVVGSRYIPQGNIVNWPWYRYFLSKGANIYASTVLNVSINEMTGGFNRISRKILEDIDLSALRGEGYAFQIELKYRALQKGFTMKEIPITFKEREHGVSKISKAIIWEAFWLVLRLRLSS